MHNPKSFQEIGSEQAGSEEASTARRTNDDIRNMVEAVCRPVEVLSGMEISRDIKRAIFVKLGGKP